MEKTTSGKKVQRIILLIILHVFEIAVMVWLGRYIYDRLEDPLSWISVGGLVVLYILYLFISRRKDYQAVFEEPYDI